MKKLKVVGILAVVVLIVGSLSIPLINNHTAYKVEKALCEIPLPEETELIESLSQAGKLTGNGNGMQYFGAILIKSELSLEELDAYYSEYRSNEWEYLVEVQEGQSVEMLEHGGLQFSEEIKGNSYYIVYSWGSGYTWTLKWIGDDTDYEEIFQSYYLFYRFSLCDDFNFGDILFLYYKL